MDLITWFQQQLNSNPVFNGVMGAAILGAVTVWLRQVWSSGRSLFSRYFTTSFSVTNEDQILYAYVNDWLKTKGIHKSPRRVILQKDVHSTGVHMAVRSNKAENDTKLSEISDQDSYFGWYHRRPLHIEFSSRDREQGPVLRVLKLTFYFRGPNWLSSLVQKFQEDAGQHFNRSRNLAVWNCSKWSNWSMKAMPFRELNTLYLDPVVKESLLHDISKFLGAENTYKKIGKPYRRNYLLHGAPGSGKTSLIWALATFLNRDVYVFTDLSNLESFEEAYSNIAAGSIIVFEDIDCVGAQIERASTKDTLESPVKMSSLLNALDGVHSLHNSILFITTNHLERLDPAFLRPGRMDVKVHMGRMPLTQVPDYLSGLSIPATSSLMQEIAALADENQHILPADLQETVYNNL